MNKLELKYSMFNDKLRDLAMWAEWEMTARCAPSEQDLEAFAEEAWNE